MSDDTLPWRQYICRACGLIYDEKEGDPDSGLAPGTRFEDIPDDWECPLCGVTKTDFELFEKREIAIAPQAVSFSQESGVVVVGAGIAGWSVVESLREEDADVPITLISGCSADRYHKPELAVSMSRGLDAEKLIRESGLDAAKRLRVRLMSHTYAVGLSPSMHQLRTTRGSIPYTQLVLAQGSRPMLPDTLAEKNCWRVNDLKGWQGLEQALRSGPQHVAIVGSGMIGCELAEDLQQAGHQVTIVSREARPLERLLPEVAATRLRESLVALGIHFLASRDLTSTQSDDTGHYQLMFEDGSSLECDQLVAATGLATDNRLACQAGLAFDRGIAVDPDTLQTSEPDIYALGDCISLAGEPCRFIEPIKHQAQAIAHGILGLSTSHYEHQQPVVRLKTRSLPIVIHGMPVADGEWHTVCDNDKELIVEQRIRDEVVAQLQVNFSKQRKAA